MEHYHLHEGRIYYRTVLLDCIRLALMYIITPSDCYSRLFFSTILRITTVYIIKVKCPLCIFTCSFSEYVFVLHWNLSSLLLTVCNVVCIHLLWNCLHLSQFRHPAWKIASKTQRKTHLSDCMLAEWPKHYFLSFLSHFQSFYFEYVFRSD